MVVFDLRLFQKEMKGKEYTISDAIANIGINQNPVQASVAMMQAQQQVNGAMATSQDIVATNATMNDGVVGQQEQMSLPQ